MGPLIEYQKVAARWLEWACGPSHCVAEKDPIYQAVTEGRDKPTAGYSSCGDLAHWMLFRLGVRLPWVNRAEHIGWRVGRNVSSLCWPPAPARPPRLGDKFEAGDVLIVWRKPDAADAHVICVVDHIPSDHVLLTAEYGQPGGALRTHVFDYNFGNILIGTRPIRRVLRLADVLDQAQRSCDLVDIDPPPQDAPFAEPPND